MNIIYQTNHYSCGICSLAMILDTSVENLIRIIGHDGSEEVFEDEPLPNNTRAFHLEELKDACRAFGFFLVEITLYPGTHPASNPDRIFRIFNEEQAQRRFAKYVAGRRAVLSAQTKAGHDHMVAFADGKIYDPSVGVYEFADLERYVGAVKYAFILV